jgi:hypothetical protein
MAVGAVLGGRGGRRLHDQGQQRGLLAGLGWLVVICRWRGGRGRFRKHGKLHQRGDFIRQQRLLWQRRGQVRQRHEGGRVIQGGVWRKQGVFWRGQGSSGRVGFSHLAQNAGNAGAAAPAQRVAMPIAVAGVAVVGWRVLWSGQLGLSKWP